MQPRSGLRFRINCEALNKALRLTALRITRCYRTVSTPATLFLAEVPPEDVLAKERGFRTRREQLPKQQLLDAAIPEWQPGQSRSSSGHKIGGEAFLRPCDDLPSPGSDRTWDISNLFVPVFQSWFTELCPLRGPRRWRLEYNILLTVLGLEADHVVGTAEPGCCAWDVKLILCGSGRGQHQRSWGVVEEKIRRVILDMIESIMEGKEAEERGNYYGEGRSRARPRNQTCN